jgi:serine O-acetyltransferase
MGRSAAIDAIRARHPSFRVAVRRDVEFARRNRGVKEPLRSRRDVIIAVAREIWNSDAFGSLVLYRLKAACRRRGIPVVPRLAHRAAMMWSQLTIGDPVVIEPGVIIPHGQVVIDGITQIGAGTRIRPFVTIGLVERNYQGPTIGRGVKIGTGAKIIGPVHVGDRAVIGANAVVVDDVPADTVVVGVPARPIR